MSHQRTSIGLLLALVHPHRRTLAFASALGLVGVAGGLAQPLVAREVIAALALDRSLLAPLVLLGALVLVSALAGGAHFWLLERCSERVVLAARQTMAARLLGLRLSALDAQSPGDLVARVASDSTLLGSVSSTALVQLLNGSVALVGAQRIVVLDGGRVRAVGTHAELLRTDALYAELATTQLVAARAVSHAPPR